MFLSINHFAVDATTIARVQGNCRGTSETSPVTVTMTSTPTLGNTLIATIAINTGLTNPYVASITETGVNWTMIISESNPNASHHMDVEIWEGKVGSGASKTISVAFNHDPGYGGVADVCEYSGIANIGLDKTANNYGNSATTDTGTTSTTTQATELFIGATVGDDKAQSSATNGFQLLDGAVEQHVSLAYLEYNATSTRTADSGTTLTSTYWCGCIATFATVDIDLVPPTYSNIATNATCSGQNCQFSVQWSDNFGVSGFIFGSNNTGTFTNNTWTATSTWGNFTTVLGDIVGVVQWEEWGNDTSNHWNNTGIQTLSITGLSYSNVGVSTRIIGLSCLFSVDWSDTIGLATTGGYIFGTNNTGSWVNNSWVAFATNPAWSNTTVTLNGTVGLIGWEYWANNTSNEWYNIRIQSLTTIQVFNATAIGTTQSSICTRMPIQRRCFYASGLYWAFYCNGSWSQDNGSYLYRTSSDCVSWSSPVYVRTSESGGADFSIWLESPNIIDYAGGYGGPIYYRNGTLNANGTISWVTSEQNVTDMTYQYDDPAITVDSNGYPWISYLNASSGHLTLCATTSSTKNGIWTQAANCPYLIFGQVGADYDGGVISIGNGEVYAPFVGLWDDCLLYGKLWNGTAWGNEETISTHKVSGNAIIPISPVCVNNTLYVAFLISLPNGTMNIDISHRYSNGNYTETTAVCNVGNYSSPVLACDATTGNLYIFWAKNNYTYYTQYNGMTTMLSNESVEGFAPDGYNQGDSSDGTQKLIGFMQVTNGRMGLMYMTEQSSPYNIKFLCVNVNTDTIPPTYSNPNTNTTLTGQLCQFNVTINDDVANGYYVFGTNNTGSWKNDTITAFSSTPQTISTVKTLNNSISVIQWEYWFEDQNANWNNTGVQSLTTTEITSNDGCAVTNLGTFLYSKKQYYYWSVNVSDTAGYANITTISLNFSTSASNYAYGVKYTRATSTWSIVGTTNGTYFWLGTSTNVSSGTWTNLTFNVMFGWNYPFTTINAHVISVNSVPQTTDTAFTLGYVLKNTVEDSYTSLASSRCNAGSSDSIAGTIVYSGTSTAIPNAEVDTVVIHNSTHASKGYEAGNAVYSVTFTTDTLVADNSYHIYVNGTDLNFPAGDLPGSAFNVVSDSLTITISNSITGRVNINANASGISYTIKRDYDGTSSSAVATWNDTFTKSSTGLRAFMISSVSGDAYGISLIRSENPNSTSIIWDQLVITLVANVTNPLPSGATVLINVSAIYQYDSAPATSWSFNVYRNATHFASANFTDSGTGVTYQYTIENASESTYGLSVFSGNTLTVTWASPGSYYFWTLSAVDVNGNVLSNVTINIIYPNGTTVSSTSNPWTKSLPADTYNASVYFIQTFQVNYTSTVVINANTNTNLKCVCYPFTVGGKTYWVASNVTLISSTATSTNITLQVSPFIDYLLVSNYPTMPTYITGVAYNLTSSYTAYGYLMFSCSGINSMTIDYENWGGLCVLETDHPLLSVATTATADLIINASGTIGDYGHLQVDCASKGNPWDTGGLTTSYVGTTLTGTYTFSSSTMLFWIRWYTTGSGGGTPPSATNLLVNVFLNFPQLAQIGTTINGTLQVTWAGASSLYLTNITVDTGYKNWTLTLNTLTPPYLLEGLNYTSATGLDGDVNLPVSLTIPKAASVGQISIPCTITVQTSTGSSKAMHAYISLNLVGVTAQVPDYMTYGFVALVAGALITMPLFMHSNNQKKNRRP